ncbi:MAG TPA: carboxylesterase family protein [Stellaceae bacterium]|jgi:para-nitrobenzyl esterase|nr:carboxylesterase family protein [Stellaceae bacterium]
MRYFLSVMLAGALGLFIGAAQAADTAAVVKTGGGRVHGIVKGPVVAFLGIPYAAPPIGALRWQPPREAQPWPQTLQATHYANYCPQANRGIFAAPSNTEDCLYLNVFAPKAAPNRGPGQVGKRA